MGRSKNPDVVLKELKPSDQAAANRLGVLDNNGKVFAFAQVQSDQDNLSYVVIAENHPKGAPLREFLEKEPRNIGEDPLLNVREAFQKAGAQGEREVQIRSCCNFSKNVAVLLVGKDGSTVTLLDRFVEAEFDDDPPGPTTPIKALRISTKPDKPDKEG